MKSPEPILFRPTDEQFLQTATILAKELPDNLGIKTRDGNIIRGKKGSVPEETLLDIIRGGFQFEYVQFISENETKQIDKFDNLPYDDALKVMQDRNYLNKVKIKQGIYFLNEEEGQDGYFNGMSLKYLFIVTNEDDLLIALEDWAKDSFSSYKVAGIELTGLGNYLIKVQVKDLTDDLFQEKELYLIKIPTASEWKILNKEK